jgi:stearoyl-CoA desaturase (delta-9 desaturase)
MFILFTLGVNGGFHKLFAHKQYKTGKFFEYFLLFFGSLATVGSSIVWVIGHKVHHRFVEHPEKDPYYPHDGNWLKVVFRGAQPVDYFPLLYARNIAYSDKVPHLFVHNHYFKLLFSYVIILGLISPELIIWMWALPAAMFAVALHLFIGCLAHSVPIKHGFREYNTEDMSINSHIFNLITFGESYHNTHHAKPNQLVNGKYDILGNILSFISK